MNFKTLAAAAALVGLAAAPAYANKIVNGGFETGDFTGWTQGGNLGFTGVTSAGFAGNTGADTGTFWAFLGPIGSDGTLSQTFTDTPGLLYVSKFAMSSDGFTPNDFSVTGPAGLTYSVVDDPAHDWIHFFGFFVGTGTDTITFSFRNDPGYLGLDSVVVGGAVPEPATWATMILGMGLAGAAMRRRKAIAAA